ncbi:MAG TPA: Flp family type IVb pilin [Stellaceae bacterium]|nr:Flp family type IVb pilin [Stellaceae bacterium]
MLIAIQRFVRNNKGVTAVEYALIAAMIAIGSVNVMKLTGKHLTKTMRTIARDLK